MTQHTPQRVLATFLAVIIVTATVALAEEPAAYFRQNCMSCHTIGGGRLVGPDLKDVTKRAERPWLTRFVSNPKQLLDSGDSYALKLKEEARGAIMPNISGLDEAKAAALLDLIEKESALPKSQFAGLNIGDEPFGPSHIRAGRAIFEGTQALGNGGPACLSCHSVDHLATLGGGKLGPDLTKVFERLNGRRNLASWLQAPATMTMRPLFVNRSLTNDEITALVAFLEDTAKKQTPAGDTSTLSFLFLGLGGSVLGFLGADAIWRKRFRGVRKSMVRGDK